ncbi:flagellar assembly protein FliX [Roseomonas sp. CCTCC AB2023176]|uniref:flagellar assembly protein FliX n=1 Tax=Roseomonas sp. CCTCC AB2023176 TaxID=3342640 RepID=UPI0035E01DFC
MDGIASIGRGLAARTARPASSPGGFRLAPSRTETLLATAAADAVAPPPVPTDDSAARDRRAAARARRILADLATLQAGLLSGTTDAAALRRLAESAAAEKPSDPVLAEALAALSLRAQVELARHGNTVARP